jgi:hypothetical protein
MDLSNVTVTKLLFNPKEKGFEKKMISRSKVFDFGDVRINAYIILVYDINSEFRKNIREYLRRKTEVGILVGFKFEKGVFEKKVEDMLVGENDQFNKAMIEYVSYLYERDYKHLVILEFNYHKLSIESLKVWDAKVKALMGDMKDEMEYIEKKLFGGEETMNARRSLYEGTERTRLRIRKEDEIEEFELNGLSEWNPYGDYTPEKLKFVGDKIPS